LPSCLKALREEWVIGSQRWGQGESWTFSAPPQDRLECFLADVADLLRQIERSGAEPILVTHARRAAFPARPEDGPDLRAMRMFVPRATAATLIAFEVRANAALRSLGRQQRRTVIDADAVLSGKRPWFADLVHFNNQGAARMAALLAEGLRQDP